MTASSDVVEATVKSLLSAIESRDPDKIEANLGADATWQNVPHAVAGDRHAVMGMLAGILQMSDRVEWEVLSASYTDDVAFLERVDKFWIGGVEYGVPCNGIFEVDTGTAVVTSVRDYVDLGAWREQIGPVYEAWANRPAIEIVQRHIDYARAGHVVGLASDYADHAVLLRGNSEFTGYRQILEYFRTVPERLGTKVLTLDSPTTVDNGDVAVTWKIEEGGAVAASGTDTYTTSDGWITHQTVTLDGTDF